MVDRFDPVAWVNDQWDRSTHGGWVRALSLNVMARERSRQMRFHFTSFNHAPPYDLTLIDMYRWLRAGLEECGHQVTYSSDAIDGSAINIIWEGFAPEAGADLASSGVDYGLIVTEFMDGYGFNFGTPMADEDNRRDPVYQARAEGFRRRQEGLASFGRFESSVAPLRDLAPASFVELGYSARSGHRPLKSRPLNFRLPEFDPASQAHSRCLSQRAHGPVRATASHRPAGRFDFGDQDQPLRKQDYRLGDAVTDTRRDGDHGKARRGAGLDATGNSAIGDRGRSARSERLCRLRVGPTALNSVGRRNSHSSAFERRGR